MPLLISEWLPNPKGTDAAGEWIELFNSGARPVSLGGFRLTTKKGKKPYIFGQLTLQPQQYLVLPRSVNKLNLGNQDEHITLYDPRGAKIDESAFVGVAPEGKSFSRLDDGAGAAASGAAHNDSFSNTFFFTDPTPGAANAQPPPRASVLSAYPDGTVLNPTHPIAIGFAAAFLVGIGLTLAITTIIGRNAELSDLFFN